MNKEVTVSAKTIDDAITEATIELGLTSDQLEYDVIEKGSAGFLGIGAKQAVIKARKKVEKPVLTKDEKPVSEPKIQPSLKEQKKELKQESKQDEKKVESTPAKEKETEEKVVKKEVELVKVEEETIKVSENFLKDVLATMDMEVTVESKIDEEGALEIDIAGENMGILIGKRGQTLDSLQYLTNRVANKAQDGYVRVKLDTENYRARRKATLENLAKNISYKVKRSRKAVSLEPMNPYERRIIHSALQGDKNVSTHSEGDEPYRRVVITPSRKY
ncbi:MAG: protein jag [Lachnospiraceae bacterium]|nr:protein jag [Lachnospiraceae bacterium]